MISYLDMHDFGRFGNRLFMIAGTIGLALKNGFEYGFLPWQEQVYFKHTLPALTGKLKNIPKPKRKRYSIDVPFYHDPDVKIYDDSFIFGFMQTDRYFKDYEQTIRHYFELKLQDWPYISNAICLHFRGTDYRKLNFPLCTKDYYIDAISMLPDECTIFVFSDEVETVQEMFKNTKYKSRVFYKPLGHYIDDFYMMSRCKHFILSNSTFAWWAAWLCKFSDKKVIAPSKWYAPGINKHPDHIYCDEWIII